MSVVSATSRSARADFAYLVAVLTLAASGLRCSGGGLAPSTKVPGGRATAAAALMPHWSLPKCPLRYEILTTEQFESAGLGSQLVTFATLDASPKSGALELRLTQQSAMKLGKFLPYAEADTGLPSLSIATDGERWRPRGESLLFAGLGSQGGLGWLFPDLPNAENATWEFPIEERAVRTNGVWVVHSSQTKQLPVGKILSWPLTESLSPESGHLVLRSSGPERWSSRSSPNARDEVVLDREGEIRTEHVFTQEGRLLRAQLERDVALTLSVGTEAVTHSRIAQRSTAHLVNACDGPTEPTLQPPLTREERAIDAVGRLARAVNLGHEDSAVLQAFSKDVRSAWSDAELLGCIGRYLKQNGAATWAAPVLVADADVVVTEGGIELSAASSVQGSAPNSRVMARFRFELTEQNGRFLVNRVTAGADQDAKPLLEIDKAHLFP